MSQPDPAKILDDIDDIMKVMRPRYHMHPTMDGKYPCWTVWLPNEGTTTRKTLKQAVLDFADQTGQYS